MGKRLTVWILIALAIGLIVGWGINIGFDKERATEIARYLSIVTDLFLRLIKMIIAPLVLSTLIMGIAHMGDTSAIGRLFTRTIGWFITASVASLSLGLLMVNVLQPGVGLELVVPNTGEAAAAVAKTSFDLKTFVTHLVPKSLFEAMANNEVLQIVVFSMFAGLGLLAIGDAGKPLTRGLEALALLMLKITGYVMLFAPFAVFAAVAGAIATQGLGIVITFGKFMGGFYLSLFLLWLLLLGAGVAMLGTARITSLVRHIREPFLLAFRKRSRDIFNW